MTIRTQALLEAISGSEIFTARLGDEPVFIIGCGSSAEPRSRWGARGSWAPTRPTRYPGALTKITRHYVGLFKERWPVLLNYVDARNTASVRWLSASASRSATRWRSGCTGSTSTRS
jgi:hypothetical protein